MDIKKAVFVKSMKNFSGYTGGLPEIAIAGKSNIGKSSLINYLCNHSKLAKTSSTPGKTRLINFFLINDAVFFVDLPGYGYAKVSKAEQSSWGRMVEDYLQNTRQLRAMLILLDIRHHPTENDIRMIDYAAQYGIPFIVAATKSDKIAKSKRPEAVKRIKDQIGFGAGFDVIPVSSTKKLGKQNLLKEIAKYI